MINKSQIEDIYGLSPMQEGMLFHMLAEHGSEAYFEQVSCELAGELDLQKFQRSWQEIVDRHRVFRTSFHWDGLDKPVQVVHKSATLPWEILDWSGIDGNEIDEKFENILRTDRQKGFDHECPPLMRCTIVRTGEKSCRFIWSHHHMLMDGWCSGIILSELFKRYEGHICNKKVHFGHVPPYKDYISWLNKQDQEKAADFWRAELSGFDTPTPLGIGVPLLPGTDKQSYAGHTFELPADSTMLLSEWTKRNGITANTFVQGAWAILLSRYSREPEVIFGATVSGRPPGLTNVESIVGLFINSLPVRVHAEQDTSIASWLKDIQNRNNERNEFAYTSLVNIKKATAIPGEMPLFNSLVVFENYPFDPGSDQGLYGLEITNIKSFEETNYPLTLLVIPKGGKMRFQLSYFDSCFTAGEIERLCKHLETIMMSMLSDAMQAPSQVSLLAADEEQKVLVQFNKTATPIHPGNTVLDLINRNFQHAADSIAIVTATHSYTYEELERYSRAMRHLLQQSGITKGCVAAISLPNSPELIVSMLGILKTGSSFLPIDPSTPTHRAESIIADAGATVLITTTDSTLEANDKFKILRIDIASLDLTLPDNDITSVDINPADVAYIIYTSGSTGKPKGVCVPHAGLYNYVAWANSYYFAEKTEGGSFPLFTSPAFDLTLSAIFIPLCRGKAIQVFDTADTGIVIDNIFGPNGQVDAIKLTPSHLTLLAGIRAGNKVLRTLIVGGEQLRDEHVSAVHEKWPGVIIYNEYGPTEATIGCTAAAVSAGNINIGKPIANTRIYILDAGMKPLPVGIKGEMYIGGAGLAAGYAGQPDLTASKFIASPFTKGERIYKTGDIACWLEDGAIQYFGRADEQVKIRGYRIEPGEIEKCIATYPGVADAVVIPVDQTGGKILVAFVKTQEATFSIDGLRAELQQQLPAYMVPAQFSIHADFPLTANGKTDRKKLPGLFSVEHGPAREYKAPSTHIEEIIASIWSNVLGTSHPGTSDNFFDMGGHSLNATQMASRLRRAFKVNIGVKDVIENQTIAQLASVTGRLIASKSNISIPPIARATGNGEKQLSFAQQRLWFLDKLHGASATYNIPELLQLDGALNKTAIESAFTNIITRHEILRTNFREQGGIAQVVIHAPVPVTIPTIPAESREHLIELLGKGAELPFDLAAEPLIRIKLFRTGEASHVLAVTMHHIISDGWSSGIFVAELAALYRAYVQGTPSSLQPLPVQYTDFAAWQRKLNEEGVFEAQLSYWQNKLSGAPLFLDLPTDHVRPAIRTEHGSNYRFVLSKELTNQLQQLSNKSGATLFMTLLSAYSVLLSKYSRQEEVLIGSSIANRNHLETEKLIGFFINILVYRVSPGKSDTFLSLIDQVKQLALEAYAHQDVPFDLVVDRIQPERDMSYSPVFQVAFDMQNTPMPAFDITGLQVQPVDIERPIAKFDLSLSMEQTPDGVKGRIEYNTDLFRQSTIEQMAAHYITTLEQVAENAHKSLNTISLLGKEEHRKIVRDWNNTDVELPAHETVLDILSALSVESPDKIAFEFEDKQLSYRQLENQSATLACHLLSSGLEQGDAVGVLAHKSERILPVILGIMKAGGVYLPVDPDYPDNRKRYMLENAGARILMAHGEQEDNYGLKLIDYTRDEVWNLRDSNIMLPKVNKKSQAYIIYTSGSTGTPKGVMLHHAGLLNTALAVGKAFLHTRDGRNLQFAPLSFDASIAEIFGGLCCGGTLVMAPKHKTVPGTDLTDLLHTAAITHVILPPSVLKATPYVTLPLLQVLISAGESCTADIVNTWGAGRTYINAYGPTECTVCATSSDPCKPGDPINIGRPIDNVTTYILDENLNPLPAGIPGELYIGGAGVGTGYIGLPEQTADRFIADPFSGKQGARMYKSGDLAKYMPDGRICFISRKDRQVKLRGFRIEPGEIEAAIAKYPSVQQAVIEILQNEKGHESMYAFVTLADEHKPGTGSAPSPDNSNWRPSAAASYTYSQEGDRIAAYLKEQLPAYLQPNDIIVLNEIPLTNNGKVDSAAIRGYRKEQQPAVAEDSAARTQKEQILTSIWTDVLGLDNVGLHSNFFKLGGDSILSIQIVSRARSAGLEFTARDIFEKQTISQLAAIAKEKAKPVGRQERLSGTVPLLPIQLWFFEQKFEHPDHFNQAVVLETEAATDPSVIDSVVSKLADHHDILRARFSFSNGEWTQEIMQETPADIFTSYDLSSIAAAERETEFLRLANDIQASLRITDGTLVKVASFDMGAGLQSRLLFVIHHLIVDGVSWRILLEDFFNAMSAPSSWQPPQKDNSTSEWVSALTNYVNTAMPASEIGYWDNCMSTAVDSLPADYTRDTANEQITGSGILYADLDATRTEALQKAALTYYRADMKEFLFTAFALACSNWTGSDNVYIEMEGHGRENLFKGIEISRTVGWFTSIYPVNFSASAGADIGEHMQRVKELLRSIPENGIGFGLLKYLSDRKGQYSTKKSPEIVFNYLGKSDSVVNVANGWKLSDADCGHEQSPANHRTHPLGINLIIVNGALRIILGYDKYKFSEATISALADSFIKNLDALADHCAGAASVSLSRVDFPMLEMSGSSFEKLRQHIHETGYSLSEVADIYPLSPLQEGLLFESLLHTRSVSYREQLSVIIKGLKDPALFREAWQHVINKYDILRTAFFWEDTDRPVQVVLNNAVLPWEEIRLPFTGSEDTDRSVIQQFLEHDIERPFSFARAPLMRFTISRMPDNNWFFCWTHHHILLDGWCLPIMVREVMDNYNRLAMGKLPAQLQAKPYSDFIRWLGIQDADQAKKWWSRYMDGFSQPTPIATGISKKANAENRTQLLEAKLSTALENNLKCLSRDNGITTNILIHAAWAMLLHHYSGSGDVVFGATVSGRPADLDGVEQMVGLFINSVPVRIAIDKEKEIMAWLQELQATQLERDQYSHLSLTQIRKYSGIDGSTPLFESLVIFENYPIDKSVESNTGGLSIETISFFEQTHYPITLMIVPATQLTLRISYDASRIPGETIAGMLRHMQNVLKCFVSAPGSRLGEISLIDEEEKNLVLRSFNACTPVINKTDSIASAFSSHAQLNPGATALIFEKDQYTYGEISLRVSQLAGHLVNNGLKNNDIVALYFDRSPELVISLLAVLRAGAAYLPLDPGFPAERLRYMVSNSGAKLLLTQAKYRDVWENENTTIHTIEEIVENTRNKPVPELPADISAESLAYVIYTSGSTGKPKGVQVSHGALNNFLVSMKIAPGISSQDILLAVTSVSFDIAGLEIFLPLTSGAVLALLPDEVSSDPQKLINIIDDTRPTIMQATPTTWQMLISNGWEGSGNLKVLCGGEALPNRLATELTTRCSELWNMYGPTETTIWSAALRIDPQKHLSDNGYALIGGPIANTSIYILDGALQPVPVGVAGELYIGGSGVAAGYLGLPELTSEKFMQDPFTGNGKDKLYRTGDMARWQPDSTICFLGRMDFQLKLRGFRIEAGEIEAAIKEIGGVRDVVVKADKDQRDNDCLVAFVVSEGRNNTDISAIRERLLTTLPAYMVPAAFSFMDAFPVTPNGKTDRKALKLDWNKHTGSTEDHIPPATNVQRKVHDIWAEVLGLREISIRDNFFALGGHSILATQCISRVRSEFRVDIPLKKIFDKPDIESFSESLQQYINTETTAAGMLAATVPYGENEEFEF